MVIFHSRFHTFWCSNRDGRFPYLSKLTCWPYDPTIMLKEAHESGQRVLQNTAILKPFYGKCYVYSYIQYFVDRLQNTVNRSHSFWFFSTIKTITKHLFHTLLGTISLHTFAHTRLRRTTKSLTDGQTDGSATDDELAWIEERVLSREVSCDLQ